MNWYDVWYEEADGDEPKEYLGQIQARTVSDAYEAASEHWGYEEYDLIVNLAK